MLNIKKGINTATTYDYIFTAIIILFILFRLPDIRLPFFVDEVGFYVKAVYYMQHHSISLLPGSIPGEYSRGHPLLFLFIYSLISKIGDFHNYILHSISLFFSVATLWATYIGSKKLTTPTIAIATVILLMLQPIFLAQSLMVLPEMMLSFLVTLSIYYYTQKKQSLYFITCSLALLTKESAVILPLALYAGDFIFTSINDRKFVWNKLISFLWALAPISVFVAFFILQRIQVGWFFFPIHVDFISFYYKDIAWRTIQAINFLFIKQGRILWLIIISFWFIKRIKKYYKSTAFSEDLRTISIFILYIIGVIAFASLNYSLHRYLLYGIPVLCMLTIYCLNNLLPDKRLFFISYIILCAASIFYAKSNSLMYDENLSFKEMVKVNKQAIEYMENHQLYHAAIVANSPICEEMRDTCMGYLSNKSFTNVHPTNDTGFITKKQSIEWCIINAPDSFNFKSLPFKVQKEIIYNSSFAATGIYKVVH